LHGESLTEPDARSWMFYDWDKVNRSGISFRLLSIILEDLPQLVIQSVAAAYSNGTISPVAITSIALTAMYVTRINAYLSMSFMCAFEAALLYWVLLRKSREESLIE
jgi:hypothetical protein